MLTLECLEHVEIDLFWVRYAGFDPVATLQKYRGYVPLIHVKDMDRAGQSTEVGNGSLIIVRCFQF